MRQRLGQFGGPAAAVCLCTVLVLAACQLPGEQSRDAAPVRAEVNTEPASTTEKSIPRTFRGWGKGLSRSWSKFTSRGPTGISYLKNESAVIASRYAADEVPNSLMKKPLASGSLGNDFGYQFDSNALLLFGRHTGIDYLASEGTAVFAAGDGVITFLGKDAQRGRLIAIRHTELFMTRYAYLGQFAEGLREGARVQRGDVIGTVGKQTDGSATRLHYELVFEDNYINPLLK